MRGFRAVAHGLSELRAHPWRAALSGVSLCVGVLAVVAIFTVGAITADVFVAVTEQRDGRRLTAMGSLDLDRPTPADLQAVLDAGTPVTDAGGGVALIAASKYRTGLGYPDQVPRHVPLTGQPIQLVAGRLDTVRRLPLVDGRWPDPRREVPVETILNQNAAAHWGGVGTTLALLATRDQPPVTTVVVGIVADGLGENNVYVSMPALLAARPTVLDEAELQLYLHHPTAGLAQLTRVADAMAAAGGGSLVERKLNRADHVDELLGQLRAQQTAFLAVGVLALIISALGILNIGLASVGERARELVIRRAIGATRAGLMGQMLVASVVIGLVAAALACGLAVLGVEWWVPRRVDPMTAIRPPTLPWTAATWGLVAATTTTLLGSLIPAVVAARLDVASALRD
ncbi:MAG: ABC transporter permease [Actinomycetales bacterium]|nr:ABC transporter permease [Actinomycetales bacterium]